MIEHAVDLELRQDNPAVKARKVIAATRVTHYHRISWVELPELLEVIDRFERQRLAERSSLIALRLMMLTLVRPSELREARWSEVDIEGRQWIIPAERMKTRVRHIVPLSSQARLLFDLQRPISGHTDLVFHTPNHRGNGGLRVMSNGCLSMLLRRMGFQGLRADELHRAAQDPQGGHREAAGPCRWQQRQPRLRLGRIPRGALRHAAALGRSARSDGRRCRSGAGLKAEHTDGCSTISAAGGLTLIADAGYCSTGNIEASEQRQLDAYISTSRQEHGKRPRPSRGPGPRDLDARGRMDRKLRSKAGQAIYALRKIIVEPVFGRIKGARGSGHRGPLQNPARTSQ